jgi:hypothetical protein
MKHETERVAERKAQTVRKMKENKVMRSQKKGREKQGKLRNKAERNKGKR